ncbi:MAG: MerR family transcriptional regulator [Deltaproteobacteria bacterium]|nr:MerR family transcriptional regulator [Deltaproteobacteria bacterium]
MTTSRLIPDKLYFKIGEAANITKVKPHVLRYWESEFKIVNPKKSRSRQRVYSRRDVELVLEIKRLLYKEKYTLEGAKKKILDMRLSKEKSPQMKLPYSEERYKNALRAIKKELDSIKKILVNS